MTYRTCESMSWARLLAESAVPSWTPPLTTHLPIHPVYSPDFVHVDSALTVCRRRVIKDASVTHAEVRLEGLEMLAVSFAFDDPPFTPDYHYTRLALEDGRYPIVRAEHYSPGRDLLYSFTYYCRDIAESRQSLLWICGGVRNTGTVARAAHVRAKVQAQPEYLLFDYHYIPFTWDASRWLPSDRIDLVGDRLCCDGQVFGRVLPGDFALDWEAAVEFSPDAYHFETLWDGYYIQPQHRFTRLDHALHLQAPLVPGAEKRFALAMLVNQDAVEPAHLDALAQAEPERDRLVVCAGFDAALPEDRTRLVFPTQRWGEIFEVLQVNTMQMLVRFPNAPWLMPTQGGTSERHYVWVGEAVEMLLPLLALGHAAPVRAALDYIFNLQDGGCPPQGHFTTLEGAVGTTGPRWACTTGVALALAAAYYRYTRDEDFLNAYLPKMLKAAGWIIGEIRATRMVNADGSVPITSGLMPLACATDGDVGYVFAWTDANTYRGLEALASLLAEIGHAYAPAVCAEADRYRGDINRVVAALAREDGFIPRAIPSRDGTLYAKFDTICGAIYLGLLGAIDVRTERFARYRDYMETHAANGYFWGPMDRDTMYMGTAEWAWQDIYLKLGAWKSAFMALQTFLRYGMTQDTFQVQERFAKSNPAFTPWQPNASGNGKVLDMMVKSLYYADGDGATLFGGIPFCWLQWNGATALTNLRTPWGRVSLEAVMLDDDRCRVTLSGNLPAHLRLPEHLIVEGWAESICVIPAGERALTFTMRDAEREARLG